MTERELRRLIEAVNRLRPDRIVVGTPEGDTAIEEISRLMGELGERAWGTVPARRMDGGKLDE